jgi:hypothetical protein
MTSEQSIREEVFRVGHNLMPRPSGKSQPVKFVPAYWRHVGLV